MNAALPIDRYLKMKVPSLYMLFVVMNVVGGMFFSSPNLKSINFVMVFSLPPGFELT
jgi:intracellular septation protein A